MCSITGSRDFPVVANLNITDSLLEKIKDTNYPLQIQWGPKATPPQFIQSGEVAKLGFVDYGLNTSSSLRLKGNSFNHYSTQLCSPLHASFLPASDAKDCSGELLISFKASSSISEQYIFICVPLLARATSKPSAFLNALGNDSLPGRTLTIADYLPQRGYEYITYTTCCNQQKSDKSYPVDIRVILFIKGLECSPELVKSLFRNAAKSNNVSSFSPAKLPEGIVAQSYPDPFVINNENYTYRLLYTTFSLSSKDTSGTRTDFTSSYKCVPLDPERNIKDNQIEVDTTDGEILTDVLKERTESGEIEESVFAPAKVEKFFFILLAAVLCLVILIILGLLTFWGVSQNPKDSIPTVLGTMRSWPTTLLIAVGCLTAGLIFGILINSL